MPQDEHRPRRRRRGFVHDGARSDDETPYLRSRPHAAETRIYREVSAKTASPTDGSSRRTGVEEERLHSENPSRRTGVEEERQSSYDTLLPIRDLGPNLRSRRPREPVRDLGRAHRYTRSNPTSPVPFYRRRPSADQKFLSPGDVWPPIRADESPMDPDWDEDATPAVHLPVRDAKRPVRPRAASMGVPKVVVNDELSSATPAIPASGFLSGRPYSYRKQLGPSEIRLIRILPATTTMIRCKVITLRLSELEPYIAISYAWGDSGDKHEIELDGVETRITSSLHGALKALRRRKSPVLVWADYISINQDDNEEKKWQVQRMADIYAQAESVAIWLGPESDESHLAMHLLGTVADYEDSPNDVADIIKSLQWEDCIEATVSLFERDYWKRLWVVQEVFNAQKKQVYCGPSIIDWSVFEVASNAFDRQRYHLDRHYSGGTRSGNRYNVSSDGRTYSEVLANQGPRTFTDLKSISPIGKKSLLEALLRCRTKLSANPRDKVYGLLGIMTREVQEHFPPDYNISVKKLYTNIVDFIVRTTERLDVLREAIYFPLCTNTNNLPTWVPDWSHIPQVAGLNASFGFSASGSTKAKFNFIVNNGVTNKIEIDAIEIDKIHSHGIAVGTLCAMADYFMAFLHWRALLLEYLDKCGIAGQDHARAQDTFCRTLCLDHVPRTWKDPKQWTAVCYHVFASLITERLRYIPLDSELRHYATTDVGVESDARRRVLYQNCGRRMQGRCFCITQRGFMGLGTGFMGVEDIVVVPLGCSTPLILRPEGKEYRIVGDVYIDGYMQGEAVAMRDAGKLEQKTYTLH